MWFLPLFAIRFSDLLWYPDKLLPLRHGVSKAHHTIKIAESLANLACVLFCDKQKRWSVIVSPVKYSPALNDTKRSFRPASGCKTSKEIIKNKEWRIYIFSCWVMCFWVVRWYIIMMILINRKGVAPARILRFLPIIPIANKNNIKRPMHPMAI